jgi:hypothetical protein
VWRKGRVGGGLVWRPYSPGEHSGVHEGEAVSGKAG